MNLKNPGLDQGTFWTFAADRLEVGKMCGIPASYGRYKILIFHSSFDASGKLLQYEIKYGLGRTV